MAVNKEPKSKIKIIVLSIIISIIAFYGYTNNDSNKDTFNMHNKDKFTFKYGKSYINRTGKEIEEKKTTLSDDYWTGGKFGF